VPRPERLPGYVGERAPGEDDAAERNEPEHERDGRDVGRDRGKDLASGPTLVVCHADSVPSGALTVQLALRGAASHSGRSMMVDPPGTFVIGRMNRIEDVDDRACALVGYSLGELRALHGSQLIPPQDRAAVAVSLDRMRRGEEERRHGHLLRKDGTTIPVEVTARRGVGDQLTLIVHLLGGDVAAADAQKGTPHHTR